MRGATPSLLLFPRESPIRRRPCPEMIRDARSLEAIHVIHSLRGRDIPRPRRGPRRLTPPVNDLAIRVGTVNGSGSQSANLVLLRALYGDGHPVQRQERLPLEHRGAADLVPHPGQRQGLRRPPARHADPGLHERADGRRRRPPARAGLDLHLPRRLRRPRRRSATTSGSSPCRSRSWSRRRTRPTRRTRATATSSARSSTWSTSGVVAHACGIEMEEVERGDPPRVPRPQGEGRRDQHRAPPQAGLRLGRGEPAGATSPTGSSGSTPTDGQDPDRGEQGRRAGRALRRGQRADLVPDHPVEQPGRVRRGVPQEAPDRPRRQADLRRRPGRGRAGGRRHGHRRRLGRGPGDHRHLRAGHLADDRVRRPGLLRRDPRRHHRRPADGAEHRPADPDQPGRHPQAPPARPRRLPAHRPDPRLGRRVLLADRRGARPGPAVPDARSSSPPTSTSG